MRIRVHSAWLCAVLVVAGCGGSNSSLPKLMPVSGTVTLDGKPCSGVVVSFIPIGSTHGTGAGGYTDKAGKYELTATHGGKGTPVGEYRVIASKLVMPDGSDFPFGSNLAPINSSAREFLPPKYSDRTRTVLRTTVHDGNNTIDFPITSTP